MQALKSKMNNIRIYIKMMIKIISTVITRRLNGQEKNLIDLLALEKEVSDFIDNHKQQTFKTEWIQNCLANDKHLFIVMTAIISPIQ